MHDAIHARIDELKQMRLPDLWEEFERVIGEQSRTPNKVYLIRRIVSALESQAASSESPEPANALESQTAADETPEPVEEDGPEDAPNETASDEPAPSDTEPADDTQAPAVEPGVDDVSADEPEPHDPEPVDDTPRETDDPVDDTQDQTVEPEAVDFATDQPVAPEGPDSIEPDDADTPLRAMSVQQLRQRYLEVVGRSTNSHNSRYLQWRIREAQKGRVRVGPPQRRSDGVKPIVLPVRVPPHHVEKLDAAWRRLGLRSRSELFRRSLSAFLENAGESETASLFADQADGSVSDE